MASAVHQSRSNTSFTTKTFKAASPGIPISTTRHSTATNNGNNIKSASSSSRPSSPRLQAHQAHQPYSNQLRSATANINNKQQKYSSSSSQPSVSSSFDIPTSFTPIMTIPSSHPPTATSTLSKHHGGLSLSSSSTISYPHPSLHPPLRLLTTATCLDTFTCLVSAQSPPHSPTFSALGLPPKLTSSSSITSGGSGGSGSRANSILDGIQSALGVSSSSPPSSSSTTSTMKNSSSYSAAKESLADFSIAASKRSSSSNTHGSSSNGGIGGAHQNSKGETVGGGVVRSRSNYVSFPNFDEVDFVDVTMVEDNEEDDDEQDWSGPDSPPEDQRRSMMDEKMMRPATAVLRGQPTDPRTGLGMPTSPSQHWLLQLETYHELRVNGTQV